MVGYTAVAILVGMVLIGLAIVIQAMREVREMRGKV